MNSEQKQRFFLMMAIGLTLMLVMQYLFPYEPPQHRETVPARHTETTNIPVTAPGAVAPDVVGAAFVMELLSLEGRKKLLVDKIETLLKYEY